MRPFAVAASLALFAATALPASAQLIPDGAEPEKVADGYRFTEGPAAGPDGCIYFTDIPAELILKYDPETGETDTVVEDSGQANGLMFNAVGTLKACRHRGRDVLSINVLGHGGTPAAEANRNAPGSAITEYQGVVFNSPNDLDLDSSNGIYFTDPRYGNRDSMQMEVEGVYYASFELIEAEDGQNDIRWHVTRIIDDLTRPNGIVLSPDESILYVADNGTNEIFAYDVTAPGEIENKRLFARLNNGQGGGADGMCVDALGRLYAAGQGRIWVYNPDGSAAGDFAVGRACTNCTFGPDGKTLYITANRGLYRIELNTDEPLPTSDEE